MDLYTLPNNPQELKAIILQMDMEHQLELDRHRDLAEALRVEQLQQKDRIAHLENMLALLKRKMFGPRSEKINANQLLLFGQSVLPLTTPAEEMMPLRVKGNRARPHGRRIIPENLPREIITILVPEEQRGCGDCGEEKVKIGEVISEQLDYIPAKLFVRRFVQEKLACPKGCDASVITAEKPMQPIEKGLAGPGLLAHIATSKYADHQPLYRIEGIFARHGIEISRSTMCDWMGDLARLSRPLVELMRQRILLGKVIHTDDTTVPVQDVGKTRKGRLWVYVGDEDNPYNVFAYTPDRKKEHPQAWLKDYGGYLQADAYAGYDEIYQSEKVFEVGCWAHARRKFFDAKDKSPAICNEALRQIRLLYDVEQEAKGKSPEDRLKLRQEKSVALLETMASWLSEQRQQLLPKNPAAEAITYALNQWEALKRYTIAPFLAIDNNVAEREMRPVALGRKNWLFAGSDEGGRTAAALSSLIRSALRHGLNVEYYLRSIFAHLPGTKLSELPHLLPDQWKLALSEEEAKDKPLDKR